MGPASSVVEQSLRAGPTTRPTPCKTRLLAYYKQTSPLIGYYYAKGDLCTIDALADVDEVAAAIRTVVDRH